MFQEHDDHFGNYLKKSSPNLAMVLGLETDALQELLGHPHRALIDDGLAEALDDALCLAPREPLRVHLETDWVTRFEQVSFILTEEVGQLDQDMDFLTKHMSLSCSSVKTAVSQPGNKEVRANILRCLTDSTSVLSRASTKLATFTIASREREIETKQLQQVLHVFAEHIAQLMSAMENLEQHSAKGWVMNNYMTALQNHLGQLKELHSDIREMFAA